jgi:4-hydroxymandelate oxidase
MPILVAPTASHGLLHPDGECATARAVGASGTLMVASTSATRTVSEIASAATGPLWFQLYPHRSLEVTAQLLQRAEAAGYRAIALTADTPMLGRRERDLHNAFEIADYVTFTNYHEANSAEEIDDSRAARHRFDTWETVDWLRTQTSLPILLKGILTAEDALIALEHNVAGIIVSNHGGRQLDSAIPTIEALPEIVAAVAGRCEVYVDGGVRRGTDVLKALALGARAVLIGRPILWGLTVNGEEGVRHILELLRSELALAMTLAGRPTLASIDRSLVKLS